MELPTVIPVHKKSEKQLGKNYQPISLLRDVGVDADYFKNSVGGQKLFVC